MLITIDKGNVAIDSSDNLANKSEQIKSILSPSAQTAKDSEIQCKLIPASFVPLWTRSETDRKESDKVIYSSQLLMSKGFGSDFSISSK